MPVTVYNIIYDNICITIYIYIWCNLFVALGNGVVFAFAITYLITQIDQIKQH